MFFYIENAYNLYQNQRNKASRHITFCRWGMHIYNAQVGGDAPTSPPARPTTTITTAIINYVLYKTWMCTKGELVNVEAFVRRNSWNVLTY